MQKRKESKINGENMKNKTVEKEYGRKTSRKSEKKNKKTVLEEKIGKKGHLKKKKASAQRDGMKG